MTVLASALAVFVVLLFAVGALSRWRGIPDRLWRHPLLFALAFTGAGGVVLFFGAIEMVGRYGISGLLGLAAFTGIFIFAPLFLEPLRWISRSHAFTTLPDLLVFRFRNPDVTRLSCLLMVVACLPIAAAQFRMLATLAPVNGSGGLLLMAALAVVSCLFIALFDRPGEMVKAVPAAAACACLLGLIAVLACGYLAVVEVFGSIGAVHQWAESSGQDELIMRFDTAYALILLFFPTAFLLPYQGYIISLPNWWSRRTPSTWMIPAVTFLAALPIFPIFWAGLKLELDAPLQQYVIVLPQLLGAGWLVTMATAAMLFIGACLLIVTALALGKVMVIAFVLDADDNFGKRDLYRWLRQRRFWAAALWLVTALLFAALAKTNSVTDLTITGLIGIIQLLPGVIATLYVPKINHKGFLAGLLVGSAIWLYGIALPNTIGADLVPSFGFNIALGAENWPFWLLESLVANLLVSLLVSLMTATSEEERNHAYHCMVDNLPTPRRQGLEITSVATTRERLADNIGDSAAAREMAAASSELEIGADEHRPLALRMLRDKLSFSLSAELGTLAAERIMDRVMPFGAGTAVDDISLIESQLAGAGNALSGLAAELNKLRLYHRQTLENLPIGVCSLDPEGEILLWNQALTRYTGIPATAAEGGNLGDLPTPWGTMLEAFVDDRATDWPTHEVEHPKRGICWYDLSKYRIEERSPLYSGYQVVLMEDMTDRLKLVRELAHAERLTSVGRLAAGVAHEIGNPVTGISCLAQDMIAETAEEETAKSAHMVLDLTDRINSIVRTLMDFSRSGGEEALQSVCLRSAVNNAIQLLSLDKGARTVEFQAAIPEDLQVLGNLHQLSQVFVNLLANARDACAEGDIIDITAEVGDDRRVVVDVTDPGCGIPEELLGRVMDPFFTTKDPGKGTGLGLSLVYSIMRFHKGSVKIASPVENGRGTRITLILQSCQ